MHNVPTHIPCTKGGQGPASGAWDSWSATSHPGGEAAREAPALGWADPLRVPCRVEEPGQGDAGALALWHVYVLWAQPSGPSPVEGDPLASAQLCPPPCFLTRSF